MLQDFTEKQLRLTSTVYWHTGQLPDVDHIVHRSSQQFAGRVPDHVRKQQGIEITG